MANPKKTVLKTMCSLKEISCVLMLIGLLTTPVVASASSDDDSSLATSSWLDCTISVKECFVSDGKKLNPNMLVSEGENFQFELNIDQLIQGKFQAASKLFPAQGIPDEAVSVHQLVSLGFADHPFGSGTLIFNRAAFLVDKASAFHTIEGQQDSRVIAKILPDTKVVSSDSFAYKIAKKIPGKWGITSEFEVKFTQEVSIYSSENNGTWLGKYGKQSLSLEQTRQFTNLHGGSKDLGQPSWILVYDTTSEPGEGMFRGGKAICYFYEINTGQGKKLLAIYYQLITLDQNHWLVQKALNFMSGYVFDSIRHETAVFIDAVRAMH